MFGRVVAGMDVVKKIEGVGSQSGKAIEKVCFVCLWVYVCLFVRVHVYMLIWHAINYIIYRYMLLISCFRIYLK